MAYNELVKNFSRIRDYMREFYVYGFKSREEYTGKSARSYDDEKRRLESWLGEYMQFRRTSDGKNVFLSIDSRLSHHNPLYKAWKAKSFTDGDITLHFLLMDILQDPEERYTLNDIQDNLNDYFNEFKHPRIFDESTIRKKLKEYETEGIVTKEKQGKCVYYRRVSMCEIPDACLLDFFSEVLPCGVIGSYLLDKTSEHSDVFGYKHHYITGALDSEILCELLEAIHQKQYVRLIKYSRKKREESEIRVVPLCLRISAQSGRQYLMAYVPNGKYILSLRCDYINSVKAEEICEQFEEYRDVLKETQKYLWGVSLPKFAKAPLQKVSFTIRYSEKESFIPDRLEREKRCGTVVHNGNGTSTFTAEVYDALELLPWIRTFICRITELHISEEKTEKRFRNDLEKMYELYGLKGGGENAVQ